MRKSAFLFFVSIFVCLAARADEQNPAQKVGNTVGKAATETGQTVEHGAKATGRTLKHGTQAAERTVGKGLKNTGNSLEKAGGESTGSTSHHRRTKRGSETKASPSPTAASSPHVAPSPAPVSSPAVTPAPTPMSSPVVTPAPTPMSTPAGPSPSPAG